MITHILWDCDGCLIDSEVVSCRVAAEFYTRAGYPISTMEFIHRFAGVTKAGIASQIQAETGEDIIEKIDWDAEQQVRNKAFKEELQPINGIEEVLRATEHLPRAVASGSSLERLKFTLELTGLWHEFAPHVYSAESVTNGKPAPDIFLYAAEKIDANPATTLVIEDGVHGIHAAKAAGMRVFGFNGASHGSPAWAEKLHAAGAELVFDDMHQLPELLKERNAA